MTRTHLLVLLAAAFTGLSIFVAVAWAGTVTYFVGNATCRELVQPLSDQIDNGWSYNNESDGFTWSKQCNDPLLVNGYLRTYLINNNGLWCDAYGYGDVYCQLSPGEYLYTRAHCKNMSSSSSRWMSCYKVKQ